GVRRVDNYGLKLADALREVAPPAVAHPSIVLLSPGIYNSAYFEHVFLAREMGVPLVEGRDLFVADDRLYLRSTAGPFAGARGVSAHQRRFHRSGGVPSGQHARRPRPNAGLPRRQRDFGECG